MKQITIAKVREKYQNLRDKCLENYPEQFDYINGLWKIWDTQLSKKNKTLTIDDFWTDAIENVSNDALLEWLDAYPDGIIWRIQEEE